MFHDSYQQQVFNTIEQVKAIKSTLLNSMNISSEEFDELMDTIHKELVEYNTYIGCTRVFAQKKMNDEQEKDFFSTFFPRLFNNLYAIFI